MNEPVYLDYNATTPIDPEVVDAMLPFLRQHFGNPSSAHIYGQRAREAVAHARDDVARLIGANAEEIIFTGSATEANNLAIQGVARALRAGKRHLVTSAIEHPSVRQPFEKLREEGWEVTVVPVDSLGIVHPADVARALRADTALVSVMHANNEVGTIQLIAEIARRAHARGALLHTDAAQSIGKIRVQTEELDADLITLAGHKFYAPKGVGALYVRAGTPLTPIVMGAGQERGLRPATENVPAIVGLGKAAQLASRRQPELTMRLRALRDLLHSLLAQAIPGMALNGDPDDRLPNTLNLSFPEIDGAVLLERATAVAASVGSACHADSHAASDVLAAMGISADRARGAIRLSVGQHSTEFEIRRAASSLIDTYRDLLRA